MMDGRAWVFGDNIDTDVLAPGQYMKSGVEELARHCLESVDPEFANNVRAGDVVVGRRNFGTGSSREQAPEALKHLGVAALVAELRAARSETETIKTDLEKRRSAELDSKKKIEEERRRIERLEAEKKQLLVATNNQAAAYRQVLAARERRKVEIKSALFRLRGSDAITFGAALDHANFIFAKTGVRPAFLMAVITQESNLGANVGTCNRPGDSPAKHWSKILKPDRDQTPFLQIVKALGLDPEVVPLSCPQAGGWGGAMGPAQFIPSTWLLYQAKISAITGHQPPSPWAPRDAFAASGIYLAELGANGRTWSAERTAALKYYSGSRWAQPKNAFYGDGVMKIAADYQELIETLQNN